MHAPRILCHISILVTAREFPKTQRLIFHIADPSGGVLDIQSPAGRAMECQLFM